MNVAIFETLVRVAKAKATIPYGELAKIGDVLVEAGDDMAALGRALDEIADQEVAAGRPLLPVVVVRATGNMPGAGLFKYAKRKKLQKGDDLTFFATELKRVYDYWARANIITD